MQLLFLFINVICIYFIKLIIILIIYYEFLYQNINLLIHKIYYIITFFILKFAEFNYPFQFFTIPYTKNM